MVQERLHPKKKLYCLGCNKIFFVIQKSKRKFCSVKCSNNFNKKSRNKNHSVFMKKLWLNDAYKQQCSKSHKGLKQTQKTLIKKRKLMLEKYKNDFKFLKKRQKGMKLKPNKHEKYLILFFKKYKLPFKYVGDFSIWINGKNPDFINKKKKLIIEYFGDYWHQDKLKDKKRLNKFKLKDYKTLIIRTKDLNNEYKLFKKVENFYYGK
jgi:very-short-patch-repair endonuclease